MIILCPSGFVRIEISIVYIQATVRQLRPSGCQPPRLLQHTNKGSYNNYKTFQNQGPIFLSMYIIYIKYMLTHTQELERKRGKTLPCVVVRWEMNVYWMNLSGYRLILTSGCPMILPLSLKILEQQSLFIHSHSSHTLILSPSLAMQSLHRYNMHWTRNSLLCVCL